LSEASRFEEGLGSLSGMGIFRRRGARPAADATVQVVPVSKAEQCWIAGHLELLHTSGIDVAAAAELGDLYDELLTAWLSTSPESRPDPNPDVNLLGIGLGEHLCRRTGVLNWAVVMEEHRAEIALHAQPGDILIYPTNAVAKRWTAHEVGFLPSFAEDMADAVARIASGTAPG
jgi:hypothetical protein